MIKRHAHNLTRSVTSTMNMGLNYPTIPIEIFPGDSFRMSIQSLARFLPQVHPTMHDVFVNIETYQVPFRQLFEKIGLSWDDLLTGGEDGLTEVSIPTVTTPAEGYEPGSLADFLGIPTNYINVQTGAKVTQPSIEVSALPVIAYMHVINENYRDQNFIKKLDLTRYQEFLDGTYQFEDASGNPLGYNLFRPGAPGLFPRAWARDYFGRALPNTQRGPTVGLPIGGSANLIPALAPVIPTSGALQYRLTDSTFTEPVYLFHQLTNGNTQVHLRLSDSPTPPTGMALLYTFSPNMLIAPPVQLLIWQHHPGHTWVNIDLSVNAGGTVTPVITVTGTATLAGFDDQTEARRLTNGFQYTTVSAPTSADLTGVVADLAAASAIEIIAFRLAARMQTFGEKLQQAGARAVEFTMAFFGVRIPDDRVQRPIYHGAFRLPIAFTEVLQTSQSTNDSPLGNLSGHGITGGQNKPIHIKVIEHGYLIQIISVMPRSQYHNVLPKLYLRRNRFDIPNPVFSHVGEQAIEQIELFPRTTQPAGTRFGYVPRYSELGHLPSTVHGHMKDTFAHWHMARIYPDSEPVLSAAFRYELPTNRSFAIQDEDQIQIALGFKLQARRPFPKNPRPGIHIV